MKFSSFFKLVVPEEKTYPDRHPFFRGFVAYGMHWPAAYFSYVFSRFSWITPNRISVLRVLLSFLSIPFFLGSNLLIILGLLLFYFCLISDCIDGQLARFHRTGSLEGEFVDTLTSQVLPPSILIATGLVVYNWTGQIWGLLLVPILLSITGLSIENFRKVVFKELNRSSSPICTKDKRQKQKKTLAYETNIKYLVGLFLIDGCFQLPRSALAIVTGMIFENSPLFIYLLLIACLIIQVRGEIATSMTMYKNQEITQTINQLIGKRKQ